MDYFLILLSYVLGSVPFALIVGKIFHKTDVRNHGSGNLGATNTFRTLGKKAGAVVAIFDVLKGTFSIYIATLYAVDIHPLIIASFSVVGHAYPLFANFKGGKAVATSAGIILFYDPILFIVSLAFFLIILKISKYVSLSSMFASLHMFIYSSLSGDSTFMYVMLFLFLFIVFLHRSNIVRIINKNERKVTWI